MLTYSLQWLVLAVDAGVKSLLLALTAAIVIRVLRLRDSQVRHRVWTGVLAGMLLLPVLSQVVPVLQLPFLVQPDWLRIATDEPPVALPASTTTPKEDVDVATSTNEPTSTDLGEFSPPETFDGPPNDLAFRNDHAISGRDPVSVDQPQPPTAVDPAALTVASTKQPAVEWTAKTPQLSSTWQTRLLARWPQLLLGLWLTGVGFITLRLILGILMAWRLKRASTEIAPDDLAEFGVSRTPCQGGRLVPVLECPLIRVPLTLGFLRPVILLPEAWLEWPTEKLEAVLSHEQTHVERGDCAIAFLAEFNLCVNWFHPLAWWLRRTLSVLAEEACDDAAIGSIGDRATYARHLLEVAAAVSPCQGRLIQPGVAMARRSNVEGRIDAILDFTRPLSERPTWATTLVILALATPVIALAAALRPASPKSIEEAAQGNVAAAEAEPEAPNLIALVDPTVSSQKPNAAVAQSRSYSGRVADTDGRAIAGAQLWLGTGATEETSSLVQVATTQRTGEFSFELTPEQAARCDERTAWPNLIAKQPGYGLDWLPLEIFSNGPASASAHGGHSEVLAAQIARVDQVFGEGRAAGKTLKLRPQGAPIQGRLMTIEGKPLADVRVVVLGLQDPEVETLLSAFERKSKDLYYKASNATFVSGRHLQANQLRTLISPVVTDANGSFTLPGLGRDQLATLTFEGERVDAATLHVFVRDMEPRRIPHIDSYPDGNQETYVGRKFTHVLGPGVPVSGVVKDFKTGEPVPDASVFVERLFRETGASPNHLRLDVRHITTRTDADGRYRLVGIPPGGKHVLNAVPPKTQPWFAAAQEFSVDPDAQESKVDIQIFRGIWMEGRVTDAASGEPVEGSVEYMALQSNPNIPQRFGLEDVFLFDHFHIGADGRYRTVGLPGPGVLMVRNLGKTKYPLQVGAKDVPGYNPKNNWLPTTPTGLPLSNWALLKPIDPAVDAASFSIDLTLSAGDTVAGRVVGVDGKPPVAFEAMKLVEKNAFWSACQNGEFTLHHYDGKGPRHVFFRSLDLSQVGQWQLEGPAPKDVEVKLQPAVHVTGRLIETEDNEPADGHHLYCDSSSAGPFRLEENLTTDSDGRFTIKGLVAGLTYKIHTASRKRFSSGKNNFTIDLTTAKPGDVIELGDVTGKNAKLAGNTEKPASTAMKASAGKGDENGATTEPLTPLVMLIRGRLIDTEGRPVAGAVVRVVELKAASSQKLREWIELHRGESGGTARTVMTMQRQNQERPPSGQKIQIARDAYVATTDADGRFKIDGIGMDSVALLRLDKAGIASALVDLVAREMEPLRVGAEDSRERRVYYGAQFDYVVEPEAPVAGRLTDVDSGEPIRGARVSVSVDELSSDRRKLSEITALTDDDGKYEAHGLPRRRGNRMYVTFADQPYLSADSLTMPKPPASGPTTFDVAFKRGVWVSGVVKDQQTGEPVKGKICYTPFANNEFLKQHPRYAGGIRRMLEHFPSGETDADGKYRVLVIQGHGVVCFQAADKNAYVPGFGQEAISDLANSKVQVVDSGIDVSFHALKEIDPAADAREIVADLHVDRGRMITFKFVDPEGRRLTSVTTRGLKTKTTRGAETAEVRFTSAAETRCLEIGDDNTGLRTILRFTSEPKQTEATVTLHAPARVTGRLLDVDHQPLKDLPLDAHYTPQAGWGSSPPFCKDDPRPISDQDGRFTMLLPAGEKFSVFIRSQRGLAKLLKAELTATPGETIDLGDLEINTEDRSDAKPLQPEKRTRAENKVAQASESKTPKSDPNADTVFHYTGTVVDEAGKPVSGASIHFLNWRAASAEVAFEVIATTGADGKFEFARKKSEIGNAQEPNAWQYAEFIATKPGYGLAAGHAVSFETSGAAQAGLSARFRRFAASLLGPETNILKLAADMPIKGRIITPDGRPVAGATFCVINASEGASGSLDDWEKAAREKGANYYTVQHTLRRLFGGDRVNGPIDTTIPPVTTDADGRFTLTGLGRDRLARVFVIGPGIEATEFCVRSRSGDTIKLSDNDHGEDKWFKNYYPAQFTHVVGPSQPVTGVVKDLKTGQPLSGFFVRAERTTTMSLGGSSGYIRATTDEQGKFTLNGFPLGTGNEFVVLPPKGSKYLPAGVSFKTSLSSEPLVKDVPLTEGIVVRGKVTDAKTGKPISGYAEYFVFTDNPALEQTKNFKIVDQRGTYSTDAEGRFEIPALPGPGIVTFWANDFETYPRGAGRESITGKNAGIGGAMYAFSTWPHHVMADNCSSLTQVDPAPDSKGVDLSIALTPTQTFSARIVAADGRVPTEYFLYGERSPASWYESRGGSFTVSGYGSDYGRRLMAFEPSTDLIGRLDVTGEPPADAVITLGPATRFVGRLVDENGAPLPETRIDNAWNRGDSSNYAMMNDRRWRGGFDLERGEFVPLKGRSVITDENGRFELRGIMPGLKYSAQAMGVKKFGNESYLTTLGMVLNDVVARPGPVNDLGDVTLKPEKPVTSEEKEEKKSDSKTEKAGANPKAAPTSKPQSVDATSTSPLSSAGK